MQNISMECEDHLHLKCKIIYTHSLGGKRLNPTQDLNIWTQRERQEDSICSLSGGLNKYQDIILITRSCLQAPAKEDRFDEAGRKGEFVPKCVSLCQQSV